MATEAEQLLVKAIGVLDKEKHKFRNKELIEQTGLSKQAVNYYLTKWEKQGFIGKDTIVYGVWYVIDLPGLIEGMLDVTERELRHGKPEQRFINLKAWRDVKEMVDAYVALKSLRVPTTELSELRVALSNAMNDTIDELRTELAYLNTKKFGVKRAKRAARTALNKTMLDPYIDKDHIKELIGLDKEVLPVRSESDETTERKLDESPKERTWTDWIMYSKTQGEDRTVALLRKYPDNYVKRMHNILENHISELYNEHPNLDKYEHDVDVFKYLVYSYLQGDFNSE